MYLCWLDQTIRDIIDCAAGRLLSEIERRLSALFVSFWNTGVRARGPLGSGSDII
jgi:hypothetical protein